MSAQTTKILKTIDMIRDERIEQNDKHRYTIDSDRKYNTGDQLIDAAKSLLVNEELSEMAMTHMTPTDWDHTIFIKMMSKSYQERLIIAAALIAAEYDRITGQP